MNAIIHPKIIIMHEGDIYPSLRSAVFVLKRAC